MKKTTSSFDSKIKICTYYNGYSLEKNNISDSPKVLISDKFTRRCIQIEAHQLTWLKKSIYVVLTKKEISIYTNHQQAFNNCETLNDTVKGVYKVISSKFGVLSLGGVNLWGGLYSNSSDSFLLGLEKQPVNFKVI